MTLPQDYLDFRKGHDEGFVGNEYLMLWKPEELPTINLEYQADRYVPGMILFGSNGGGEAYGFDTRQNDFSVVMVPFIGMEWKAAIPMGATFSELIERLRKTP
jgi:hypothetical protein